jgi:hypothetical protein
MCEDCQQMHVDTPEKGKRRDVPSTKNNMSINQITQITQINQSTNQVNQSSKSINQSINQSIHQSINPSIQSIQSINQSNIHDHAKVLHE